MCCVNVPRFFSICQSSESWLDMLGKGYMMIYDIYVLLNGPMSSNPIQSQDCPMERIFTVVCRLQPASYAKYGRFFLTSLFVLLICQINPTYCWCCPKISYGLLNLLNCPEANPICRTCSIHGMILLYLLTPAATSKDVASSTAPWFSWKTSTLLSCRSACRSTAGWPSLSISRGMGSCNGSTTRKLGLQGSTRCVPEIGGEKTQKKYGMVWTVWLDWCFLTLGSRKKVRIDGWFQEFLFLSARTQSAWTCFLD